MFQLLFGDADGTPIVLPSVQETAVWLAIWVPEVAAEVVLRDPSLLLTAGDPSSLSAESRQVVLKATIAELAAGVKRHEWLDRDTLRRFATADMVAAIERLWAKYQGNADVRHLLLTMVELGRLISAADLARSVANGTFDDPETIIFGIRAIGVVGNAEDLQAIAKKVEGGVNTLDENILWAATEVLFPKYLCVDALLSVIEALGRKENAQRQRLMAERPVRSTCCR